ncbi:MAG: hypothetical protein H9847_10345, partial [Candidatus Anaerobiospirillum pullicola]|nr:hypothetical protein [Candidatus Anaerobiospirillum pullicola]
EAAKLSKNTSKAVMVLTIVERPTAKTAYLSGKINTIQLPDVSFTSAPTKTAATLNCRAAAFRTISHHLGKSYGLRPSLPDVQAL